MPNCARRVKAARLTLVKIANPKAIPRVCCFQRNPNEEERTKRRNHRPPCTISRLRCIAKNAASNLSESEPELKAATITRDQQEDDSRPAQKNGSQFANSFICERFKKKARRLFPLVARPRRLARWRTHGDSHIVRCSAWETDRGNSRIRGQSTMIPDRSLQANIRQTGRGLGPRTCTIGSSLNGR